MGFPDFHASRSIVHQKWDFDELSAPYFHAGNDVGCLVLHGYSGTPANILVTAQALAQAGYTVYAPLLSGHGTTLGDMGACTHRTWRQDALDGYKRLKDAGCKQIFVLGLSMGAILSAILAEEEDCAGAVLMSAPFRMKAYLYEAILLGLFLPYVTLPPPKTSNAPYDQMYHGAAVRKLFDLTLLARQARKGFSRIRCPLLVMQSRRDNKVHPSSLDLVTKHVSSKDVSTVWLEKSPHGCTYGPERDYVAELCVSFVNRVSGRAVL